MHRSASGQRLVRHIDRDEWIHVVVWTRRILDAHNHRSVSAVDEVPAQTEPRVVDRIAASERRVQPAVGDPTLRQCVEVEVRVIV